MKRRSISLLFVIVALALAALIVGDFVREERGLRLRETILAELQPVALKNCTLKRFGSTNDGGYLMCENLIEPIDAAYSYGVGSNDDWGCEVSRRYHVPVHEYDCFDPTRPPCSGVRRAHRILRAPHRTCRRRRCSECRCSDTSTNWWRSTQSSISARTCSGVQNRCASSTVNPRTRIKPWSVPESSAR